MDDNLKKYSMLVDLYQKTEQTLGEELQFAKVQIKKLCVLIQESLLALGACSCLRASRRWS